jgi:photosystem II stability/assembly factor-like uncharacterized protein
MTAPVPASDKFRLLRICIFSILLLPTVQILYGANKVLSRKTLDIPGSINALAIDPSAPKTLYATAENGGVFKSIDGGDRWRPTALTSSYLKTLVLDPSNPAIIYAVGDSGAFRSANAGENWNELSIHGPLTSLAIAVDPSGSQTIWVASRTGGVFKSTDGGSHFKQASPSNKEVWCLAVDPNSSETIYAGVWNGGVYKTTNGGNTWFQVGLGDRWVATLTISPDDPRTLYAGTLNGDDGLFRSTDGGYQWQQLVRGGVRTVAFSAPNLSPFTARRTLYAGFYNGVSKSTDNGYTWLPTDLNDSFFLQINTLATDPTNPSIVYAGAYAEGAFKTTDGGAHWNAKNRGLDDSYIFSFAFDPIVSKNIYAGSSAGVLKSTNSGATWVQIGLQKEGVYSLAVNPLSPQEIYAGSIGRLYKSSDGGANWYVLSPESFWFVNAMAIDPLQTKIVYAGTGNGLYKSTDGGNNWTELSLPAKIIYALTIDPSTPEVLYAGTYDGGMFKSSNRGLDWSPINEGLTDLRILSIAINPRNSQVLYAGTERGGVFKSTNSGIDWEAVSRTGSNIALDPSDPDTLYISELFADIYRSKDGGNTWLSLSSGLFSKPFVCLAVDPTARRTLFLGTASAGIWTYSLDLDLAFNGGGTVKASTGFGNEDVMTGGAELSIKSGIAPFGAAVISLKQNGVTISETDIPAAPPTTKARIFVDYRSSVPAMPGSPSAGTIDIDTGIAVANYDSPAANVSYTLRDVSGKRIAVGHGVVEGGGFAKFIDQLQDVAPDFILPPDFPTAKQFGSLEIESDRPVSILALRMNVNQRYEALLTTTAVADLNRQTNKRYIPHIVDGGGYTTSIFLLNTTNGAQTGTLHVFDETGAPMVIKRVGGGAASSFGYSIPAGGSYQLQTDGSAAGVKVGWMELDSGTDPVPAGSGIISYNHEGILVTETGIAPADTTNHARAHVDLSGAHNTGLAVANPFNADINIVVNAFEADGVTPIGTANGTLPVPAKGHAAWFADELINGLPTGFVGVLDISSTSEFAALTVRSLSNERDDFLMTTLPIADVNGTAPSPVLFPRVVSGGGYVTDFILINPRGQSDETLSIYGDENLALDQVNR